MKSFQPLSEDFLYWSPEVLYTCLLMHDIESNGFVEYQGPLSCVVNEQQCMGTTPLV